LEELRKKRESGNLLKREGSKGLGVDNKDKMVHYSVHGCFEA